MYRWLPRMQLTNLQPSIESPFPLSTIDWDDLISEDADEIALSESIPFSTIDSNNFTSVL
jgi:hypothetical protein